MVNFFKKSILPLFKEKFKLNDALMDFIASYFHSYLLMKMTPDEGKPSVHLTPKNDEFGFTFSFKKCGHYCFIGFSDFLEFHGCSTLLYYKRCLVKEVQA